MFKLAITWVCVSLSTGALAQAGPVGGTGRYVIVHSPHIQADTILLDTATGKTWQLTKFTDRESEPVAWVPLARTDNPAEMQDFRAINPPKRAQ